MPWVDLLINYMCLTGPTLRRLMDDAKVPSFGAGHETIITAKGVARQQKWQFVQALKKWQ